MRPLLRPTPPSVTHPSLSRRRQPRHRRRPAAATRPAIAAATAMAATAASGRPTVFLPESSATKSITRKQKTHDLEVAAVGSEVDVATEGLDIKTFRISWSLTSLQSTSPVVKSDYKQLTPHQLPPSILAVLSFHQPFVLKPPSLPSFLSLLAVSFPIQPRLVFLKLI